MLRIVVLLSIVCCSNALAWAEGFATLSDDGKCVTVAKVPNALQLATFSKHLGLVAPGTRVRTMETRADPQIPAKWVHVRILEGEYRGQTGWVLAPTVHEQKDARPWQHRAARSPGDSRPEPVQKTKSPKHATHQTLAGTLIFSKPSMFGNTLKQLPAGSWLERLDARRDTTTSIRWMQVRVLSGKLSGRTVWIQSHDAKQKPTRCVLIGTVKETDSWPLIQRLAKHPEIDAVELNDLGNPAKKIDLSSADEVAILLHSGSVGGILNSGDKPRDLVRKLQNSGLRRGAAIELISCRGGVLLPFFDGRKDTYGGRMARLLKQPVFAYSHYVRVEVRTAKLRSNHVTLRGYIYTTGGLGMKKKQFLKRVHRYRFLSPKGFIADNGEPLFVTKYNN